MHDHHALEIARRRLRWIRAIRPAERAFVAAGGAVVVAMIAAGVLFAAALSPWWCVAPFTLGALVLLLRSFTNAPSVLEAAVALDQRLGLRECTSSAVYFSGEQGIEPGVLAALREQASARLGPLDTATIRSAFPLPRPRAAALALLVMAGGWLLAPHLPTIVSPPPPLPQRDAREEVRDAARIRQAARELASDAEDIARLAEMRELEKARQLALDVKREALEMSLRPPDPREALSELSKIAERIERFQREALGREASGDPFGIRRDASELSRVLEDFERLRPHGLEKDLEDLRRQLAAESERAGAGGHAAVDTGALEALEERVREEILQLAQLEELMEESPALRDALHELTERQREYLDKIAEELERLAQASSERALSAEDLESLAACEGAFSEEELEELLRALREIDSAEALREMVEGAKCGACSSGSESSIARAAERRGSVQRSLGRSSSQSTSPSGLGPQGGRAADGKAPHGEEGEMEEEGTRVGARLDPQGRLGKQVPFRGIPSPRESQEEFRRTLERAIADAEDSLGHDELPADARPFVRRYFEALRNESKAK